MKTYSLEKTDLVISTPYGKRIVYYAPQIDLCFVHYTPKRRKGVYAVGGWTQIDCNKDWNKTKKTIHTLEWCN